MEVIIVIKKIEKISIDLSAIKVRKKYPKNMQAHLSMKTYNRKKENKDIKYLLKDVEY